MNSLAIPGIALQPQGQAREGKAPGASPAEPSEIGKRFEQMLWAEMLSHAGLEKSLTMGGGEAASAFSRYVVESIAEDLAETHPLGFARRVDEVTGGNPASLETGKGLP